MWSFPPNAVRDGGNGVIHMGLLNIIRWMALREKQSVREISRRAGLSRNTIARWYDRADVHGTGTTEQA
jgi:hypothetical protein